MIDFRYHLVSIVAVFLALGLGLLVGATALQPTALGGLTSLAQQERKQIDSALAANRQLTRQIDSNDQFAQAVAPQLLDQLLAGERVVVVEAPGASGQVVSGVDQALTQAGAAISGRIQLQNKFFDTSPSTEQQLSQLAQQFAPAGTSLHGSPVAQASQAMAGAVLTKDGPGQPVAGQRDAASVALLSGFGAGGFLTVTGHPDARATLAVVIIPDSPQSTSPSDPQSQRLVTLAQQLNLTGQGTVVAGSVAGSGPGSAIDVMRNGGRAGHLSSVDNADDAVGRIVVAQALYEQLRGVSGSYGASASATAPGPSPAPTPASPQTLPRQPSRPAAGAGKL
ncbi:MAG TPA: copper transporter [Streptosporangiaceae bacterium]|nr:copper transporter [Streptosporangiaceae bacterium]